MEPTNGHDQSKVEDFSWEVVGQLTPAEQREVYLTQTELQRANTQLRLMAAGSRQLWAMLQQKYQVPHDAVYNPDSGTFLRRISSPPGGPTPASAEPEALAVATPAPQPKPPRKRGKRGKR